MAGQRLVLWDDPRVGGQLERAEQVLQAEQLDPVDDERKVEDGPVPGDDRAVAGDQDVDRGPG